MTTAILEHQETPQADTAVIANPIVPQAVNPLCFNDFNISNSLKTRLATAGFVTPTPVQAKAIPPALEGADILATASTGTGKTLSFLIPMIERMDATSVPSTKGKRGPIRALILLPTRELAMQVLEAYWKLVPGSKNDAVLVCGGLSENNQLDQLDRGPRLVVATPGRLEDYLRRRAVNISAVEMLVLDEVDRMLDMGFLPAIRRIVGAVPKTRQTMCYSATLDANIREIVRDYVNKPVRIEIGHASRPSDQVELRVYTVMQDQKLGLLDQMLRQEEGTFLVFSRTKHGADRISKKLERLGHDADVIHGDRSQSQRTAALKGFQNGKHRILVATDVAARGIDVQDIAHVVNYDLPNASDDFVHRIGRTGRAGGSDAARNSRLEGQRPRHPDVDAEHQLRRQQERLSQPERWWRLLRWTQLRRTWTWWQQRPSEQQQPPREQPFRPSSPRSINQAKGTPLCEPTSRRAELLRNKTGHFQAIAPCKMPVILTLSLPSRRGGFLHVP